MDVESAGEALQRGGQIEGVATDADARSVELGLDVLLRAVELERRLAVQRRPVEHGVERSLQGERMSTRYPDDVGSSQSSDLELGIARATLQRQADGNVSVADDHAVHRQRQRRCWSAAGDGLGA